MYYKVLHDIPIILKKKLEVMLDKSMKTMKHSSIKKNNGNYDRNLKILITSCINR